jgi:hypothetical protein
MTTLKIKQTIATVFLAFTLTFGTGIIADQAGLNITPTTHACTVGQQSGGGC